MLCHIRDGCQPVLDCVRHQLANRTVCCTYTVYPCHGHETVTSQVIHSYPDTVTCWFSFTKSRVSHAGVDLRPLRAERSWCWSSWPTALLLLLLASCGVAEPPGGLLVEPSIQQLETTNAQQLSTDDPYTFSLATSWGTTKAPSQADTKTGSQPYKASSCSTPLHQKHKTCALQVPLQQ